MNSPRTGITRLEQNSLDLILDVQVVLLEVRHRVVIGIDADRGRVTAGLIRGNIGYGPKRDLIRHLIDSPVAADVGIREDRTRGQESAGARTERPRREHAESAAHHQAGICPRRVSESEPRAEILPVVLPGRVAETVLPEYLVLSLVQIENTAAVVHFVIPQGRVPAQSDIQCQLAADANVVLNEQGVHRRTRADVIREETVVHVVGQAQQETRIVETGVGKSALVGKQIAEVPGGRLGAGLQIVDSQMARLAADADIVLAANHREDVCKAVARLQFQEQRVRGRAQGVVVHEVEIRHADLFVGVGHAR